MRIGLRGILFLALAMMICALATALLSSRVSYGQQPKRVIGSSLEGSGFAIATDISGDAIRIYLASFDKLSCLDAQNWKILWSRKTPYGSIDTDPVMSDNTVFYAGGGGAWTIYGVSAETGQILWRSNHTSFWLATASGSVFVDGPGSGVTALAPRSGKKLWAFGGVGPGSIGRIFYYEGKIFTSNYVLDARTGELIKRLNSSPRVFAASEGRVFGGNLTGTLKAWEVTSAQVLWSARVSSVTQAVAVAANPGYVFAVFYKGQPFFAHHGVLKAYAASNGRLVWERPLTSKSQGLGNDPIGADSQHVYLIEPTGTAHGSRVIALDAQTGKLAWSCQTTRADGPPVPIDKTVYIASGNNVLLAIDKKSGRVLRTFPFPK